jgi:hypothetical protein
MDEELVDYSHDEVEIVELDSRFDMAIDPLFANPLVNNTCGNGCGMSCGNTSCTGLVCGIWCS